MEHGKIRVLVLDTRWFRDDHCIVVPSMAYNTRIPFSHAIACITRWVSSMVWYGVVILCRAFTPLQLLFLTHLPINFVGSSITVLCCDLKPY